MRVVAVARRKELLAQEVEAAGGTAVIPFVQDIVQEDAARKLARSMAGFAAINSEAAESAKGTGAPHVR